MKLFCFRFSTRMGNYFSTQNMKTTGGLKGQYKCTDKTARCFRLCEKFVSQCRESILGASSPFLRIVIQLSIQK